MKVTLLARPHQTVAMLIFGIASADDSALVNASDWLVGPVPGSLATALR